MSDIESDIEVDISTNSGSDSIVNFDEIFNDEWQEALEDMRESHQIDVEHEEKNMGVGFFVYPKKYPKKPLSLTEAEKAIFSQVHSPLSVSRTNNNETNEDQEFQFMVQQTLDENERLKSDLEKKDAEIASLKKENENLSKACMALRGKLVPYIVKLSMIAKLVEPDSAKCPVCFENTCDMVTSCGHKLCEKCSSVMFPNKKGKCHICRISIRDVIKTFD